VLPYVNIFFFAPFIMPHAKKKQKSAPMPSKLPEVDIGTETSIPRIKKANFHFFPLDSQSSSTATPPSKLGACSNCRTRKTRCEFLPSKNSCRNCLSLGLHNSCHVSELRRNTRSAAAANKITADRGTPSSSSEGPKDLKLASIPEEEEVSARFASVVGVLAEANHDYGKDADGDSFSEGQGEDNDSSSQHEDESDGEGEELYVREATKPPTPGPEESLADKRQVKRKQTNRKEHKVATEPGPETCS
jgi:hypothetical protein